MSDDQPGDRMRERSEASRTKLWLLMEADRRVVTGLLLGLVFVVLTLSGYGLGSTVDAVRTSDSVDTVFQGFLTATITGVTLVLTLNQLVLSQELGAVGDQRDRMEGAMSFREDAADAIGAAVSPARPAQFLRAFVQVAADRAESVRAAVPADADEDVRTAVDDLVDSLTGNADAVAGSLDGAQFGEFEVVSAALNFNYSWKLFAARRLREQSGDELGAEARDELEALVEALELFGPAREHVKTLYFQWELIDLSRAILVAGIPALLVSVYMVAFFNIDTFAWPVAGYEGIVLVIAAASTVAVAPFVVLLSYVLRIATVTKHTLSIGPFILRDTDQVSEVEWEG